MNNKIKFYICKHCGNIITKIEDSKVPVVCCGENMSEIVPNTVDASFEKHIPVIEQDNDTYKINIGSIDHPMTAEHHISWLVIATETSFQIIYLKTSDLPSKTIISSEQIIEVYAYCNLHGLWKKEV